MQALIAPIRISIESDRAQYGASLMPSTTVIAAAALVVSLGLWVVLIRETARILGF